MEAFPEAIRYWERVTDGKLLDPGEKYRIETYPDGSVYIVSFHLIRNINIKCIHAIGTRQRCDWQSIISILWISDSIFVWRKTNWTRQLPRLRLSVSKTAQNFVQQNLIKITSRKKSKSGDPGGPERSQSIRKSSARTNLPTNSSLSALPRSEVTFQRV